MKHGGSCIYVKNNLEAKEYVKFKNMNIEEHFEASIVELPILKTFIICIYRSPSSKLDILIEKLDIIISKLNEKDKRVIIIGDLNCDFLITKGTIKLQTMLNSHGLQAVVKSPTRVVNGFKSAIDQVILRIINSFKCTLLRGTLHLYLCCRVCKCSVDHLFRIRTNVSGFVRIFVIDP